MRNNWFEKAAREIEIELDESQLYPEIAVIVCKLCIINLTQ